MKFSKEENNTLAASVCIVISLFFLYQGLIIRDSSKNIILSPRLFPVVVALFMLVLSISLLVKNLKKTTLGSKNVFNALKAYFIQPEVRNVLFSLLIVSIYIFVALPFLGFYISSFILLSFITLTYVKKIKPVWAIVISAVIVAVMYLAFTIGFHIPLS